MAISLLSPSAKQQFFDNAGVLAAGYRLYTYAANTLTPRATYTDRAGLVSNINPIILDARGEAIIYLTPGVVYDYVLKTAADVTVWTREDVIADAGDATAVNFTDAVAPAYLKTTSDIINGERVSVLRNIPQAAWTNVRSSADTTDYSSNINTLLTDMAAAGFGDLYFPHGTLTATGLTVAGSDILMSGPGTIKKKAAVDGRLLTITGHRNRIEGLKFDGSNAQPSVGQINDIIRINAGNENVIRNCRVNGSKGGGICILNGAKNTIDGNKVYNVNDNGIFVADLGADDNIIIGNLVDGTVAQNGIFVTASPGSIATVNFIRRNSIIGNIVRNCGDTGIEAGIHTVSTVISNNIVENCVNPEILLRDTLRCVVTGNTVEAANAASAIHDGISVAEQTETNWDYESVIAHNIIIGNLKRSGVYLAGANGVSVEDNQISENFASVNGTTGVGLVGGGIVVAQASDNLLIRKNKVRRMSTGVNLNYAGGAVTHTRILVEDNHLYNVAYGIYMPTVTLQQGRVDGNTIAKVVTTAINNSSTNGATSFYGNNVVDLPGYSGAAPVKYGNNDWTALGWGVVGSPPVIAPTLLGTWVNNGGATETAGYWKDEHGIVHLTGMIKSGTIATAAFTLPVGYRPALNQHFPSVANDLFAMTVVNTAGSVIPQTGSTVYFSLCGISFRAA